MSENLEDLTPNQRRALNKGLAALETMAAMWGAEIRIHDVAQKLAAKPQADRAKSIAAFIEQAFIEGAYRHYLDRDPAANPELERASQPGSGEALAKALAMYDSMRDGIGGCTDGGCVIKRPTGMRTNGGCKCATDKYKAQRMMYAGQKLADAARASLDGPTEGQLA